MDRNRRTDETDEAARESNEAATHSMVDDGLRRRDVLKTAGTTGVLASLATTTASGAAPTRERGEYSYRGTRSIEYEPVRGGFEYVERFESDELRSVVGRRVVVLDEGRVERRDLPVRYRDRRGPFTVEFEDTAYLASLDEWAAQEAETRRRVRSTAEAPVPSIETLPLYSYASASGGIAERTGPISVVWDTFRDAGQIQYEMQHLDVWSGECWCSALPSKDRFVVLDDGSAPAQHAGFAKGTGYLGAQWHARLWDLPDGRVVAQPHYDVADHCFGLECDFRFDEARATVAESFASNVGDYGVDAKWSGNGSGYGGDESADGWTKVITRN
ncbi:hypothetical protein G9C85_13545 [Halorubellus sp. JP-L1]|uniref:hypothetical protein n=1 Tax=Halorubellus sp. JP-L1 TaxID=2715753 RepID=UPI00140DB955|nr:hypothetical protein [Halorubellus sp. JP-L1]NHN42646.1 hypothetical protein [Halorubellus sp. JP-L1]